jgi:threonine synthase
MTSQPAPGPVAHLACINPDCGATFAADRALFACETCGELLDARYDWNAAHARTGFACDPGVFAARQWSGAAYASDTGARTRAALNASGVWRFRELMPFWREERDIVTLLEGRTLLQPADAMAREVGFGAGELFLQYEGFNPSGSFKDNGMAAAFTHARSIGASRVVCASTGNTSASMAMYAALAPGGFRGFVLIGSGKIALGKLSQALDFGARTLQVAGDFDACLARVQDIAVKRPELGIYPMNSINPFRLEGQKAVMFRVLEAMGWGSGPDAVPDWIVVPGGNLGNCSAFGKAFMELRELGMLPGGKVPRLAVINASGARTLHRVFNELGVRWNGGRYDRAKVHAELARMDAAGERAHTVASAIEIGRPVNLPKALRALEFMNGVVRHVDDPTIMHHKALIGRHGYSCEPACAASLAGAAMLRREGVITPGQRVVCIITGHGLKDPDATVKYHTGVDLKARQDGAPRGEPGGALANRPVPVADEVEAILRAME